MNGKPKGIKLINWLLMFCGLGLLALVLSQTVDRGGLGPARQNLAAPAAGFSSGAALVVPEENRPRVWLKALSNDAKITAPETCQQDKVKTYFGGDPARYRVYLAGRARCLAGYMEATALDAKVGNAQQSIALVDSLIDLVQQTKARLDATETIDGLTMAVVPAGLAVQTKIEEARDISLKCVEQDGQTLSEAAVGTLVAVNDPAFAPSGNKHKKLLADALKKSGEVQAQMARERAKKKKLGSYAVIDVFRKVYAMENDITADFIAVYPDMLAAGGGRAFTLSYELKKDGAGRPQESEDVSYFLGFTLKHLIPGVTLSGPYMRTDVAVSDGEKTVTISDMPTPERSLLSDARSVLAGKLKELRARRAEFQSRLEAAQRRLRELELNNYNCDAPNTEKDREQ